MTYTTCSPSTLDSVNGKVLATVAGFLPYPAGRRDDSRHTASASPATSREPGTGGAAATPCNRDRGRRVQPRRSPPTPPDVRVRIRRFERLRLAGKPWDSLPVVVARGQRDLERRAARRPPPVSGEAGGHRGGVLGYSPCSQFAKDRRPALPLFELDEPQAMADPLVEVAKHAGRLRQPEELPPADEVAP